VQSVQPRTMPFAPHLESSWLPEPLHICHLSYQPGGRRACVMVKLGRFGSSPPPPPSCPLRPGFSSSLFHSLYLPQPHPTAFSTLLSPDFDIEVARFLLSPFAAFASSSAHLGCGGICNAGRCAGHTRKSPMRSRRQKLRSV